MIIPIYLLSIIIIAPIGYSIGFIISLILIGLLEFIIKGPLSKQQKTILLFPAGFIAGLSTILFTKFSLTIINQQLSFLLVVLIGIEFLIFNLYKFFDRKKANVPMDTFEPVDAMGLMTLAGIIFGGFLI